VLRFLSFAWGSRIHRPWFSHLIAYSPLIRLNFYGFVKLRSESDLQIHTQAVRFAHEFFQKGRPDLLHRITRSTAQKPAGDADGNQMEAMQERIDALERKVQHLEEATDQKIRQVTVSLTEGYMARISTMEASYERLLHGITQLLPPMGPSLSSSSLSSANAAVAAAAAAANRNGATWPNPSSSPLLGHLDPSLVSNYVRSKNQQH
jgi:HSF-type DNA-binding